MSDEVRITLRLPADVHGAIKTAADKHGRSMNAEIVIRLAGISRSILDARVARLEHWAWGNTPPSRLPSLDEFRARQEQS